MNKKFVVTTFHDSNLEIYLEVIDEKAKYYITGTYTRSKIVGDTAKDRLDCKKRWPKERTKVVTLTKAQQDTLGHYVYYAGDADAQ